jgi:hypothetical protein
VGGLCFALLVAARFGCWVGKVPWGAHRPPAVWSCVAVRTMMPVAGGGGGGGVR